MATFGYEGDDETAGLNLLNRIGGGTFTLPVAGSVTKISAKIDDSSNVMTFKAGIYKDSDLDFMCGSAERVGAVGNQWFDFVGGDLPFVLPASDYILVAWGQHGGSLDYKAGGDGHYDDQAYGAWPDPMVITGDRDRIFCIHADYTPTAGGGEAAGGFQGLARDLTLTLLRKPFSQRFPKFTSRKLI